MKDAIYTKNWELIHTAGAVTLEHHDAEGFGTFLYIWHGCKMWGICRPPGYTDAKTRAELDKLNEMFIRQNWDGELPELWQLEWEKLGGKVFSITARPGDLM